MSSLFKIVGVVRPGGVVSRLFCTIMKFCKSLQRIAAMSDPSFAPFWCNYKLLKKLIKVISGRDVASVATSMSDPSLLDFYSTTEASSPQTFHRFVSSRTTAGAAAAAAASSPSTESFQRPQHEEDEDEMSVLELNDGVARHIDLIRSNPQEVAFFRLLQSEVRKAVDFFDKVQRECVTREQLMTVGMEILKKPRVCMVPDRWSVISRAIFFLYRDLLLLETFAIMTYFSFSKILKKHDKVTGYSTRDPFMINVVNKANFTTYPKLLELIERSQKLYNEASEKLVQDLYEDERLFLNMVSEWNTKNRDPGASSGGGGEVAAELNSETLSRVSRRSRNDSQPVVSHLSLESSASGPIKKRYHKKGSDSAEEDKKKKARRRDS